MKREDLMGFAPLSRHTHDAMMNAARSVEEASVMKRRLPVAVIVTLGVILCATTALALAHTLGIIDLLNHVNNSDASETISAIGPQSGGDSPHVHFEAREAFYDGQQTYFLLIATPKTKGTSFVHEMLAQDKDELETARQYGETIEGVYCEAAILREGNIITSQAGTMDGIGYTLSREGAAYAALFEAQLPPGISPDTITFRITYAIKTLNGQTIEASELLFDVPKTVNASQRDARELDISIDMKDTVLERLRLTGTPLEMRLAIEHIKTNDRQILTFALVDPLDPDGKILRFSTMRDDEVTDSGRYVFEGTFETDGSIPDTLLLVVKEANLAAMINTMTGEYSLHAATAYGGPEGDAVGMYYRVDYETAVQ